MSLRILLPLLLCLGRGHAALADPGDATALAAVVHEVCGREVVMLGESATHGDGHTEAFKVALVEKLVNECGFDSVIFEANHYEFLQIARHLRGSKAITADEISAAVGGLWKFDREFQPLVPFLLAKAVAGKISLGGMDDQLGQLGQDYANLSMIDNLTMVLPSPQGQECSQTLHRRIYSEDVEGDGYSQSDRTKIMACLSEVRSIYADDQTKDRVSNAEWLEMIDAVQRWINRDSLSRPEQMVDRDRSMFRDFEWLRRQAPQRHKAIVWAATVHIAKQGDPTWADRTGTNFGSLVHREYGARAFSLGFSALAGTYRAGRDVHDQPAAPGDAIEQAAGSADAVYVGSAQLESLAARPGAVFRHSYETLRWSDFLDGVVVFGSERPPTRNGEK